MEQSAWQCVLRSINLFILVGLEELPQQWTESIMVTIYSNQEELDRRNMLQVCGRGEVHTAVLGVITDVSGQVGCPETSVTTNQRCITSRRAKTLFTRRQKP
jgi:hypothetical protein